MSRISKPFLCCYKEYPVEVTREQREEGQD